MSFQLTQRVIKLLCGPDSYESGEDFYEAGRVNFTTYDNEDLSFHATVKGSKPYFVTINIDQNGDVDATCSCPPFQASGKYCGHIAAALHHIHDVEHKGETPIRSYSYNLQAEDDRARRSGHLEARYDGAASRSKGLSANDHELASSVLALFEHKPLRSSGASHLFDAREMLEVEFICKPFPYGNRKYMFGIEMKVGGKRLYIVQKIREFLERIERRQSYVFSKHFIYDPSQHSFKKENDSVIRQLIAVYDNEKMAAETASSHTFGVKQRSGDRMLLVPPHAWDKLLPLLIAAPAVQLEQDGTSYAGLSVSDAQLPLSFEFGQAEGEGYQLEVQGLDKLVILEAYGIVLSEGKLLKQPFDQCRRLAQLMQMLESSRKQHIHVQPKQMEAFMERVIPGLMKLGSVHIAQSVSERVIQTQLKAKLYLDRVKDRLLAGLEFQYGDIVINPLEDELHMRGTDRILMRDGEQERQILELIERSSFAKTEGGYVMSDEDSEYDFLYHIVPQLEKLLDVYATTAVKLRIHTGNVPPKVFVEVDQRTDWLEFKFEMDGIPDSEIKKLLKSLGEKRKYHRLPNGALMPLETVQFEEIIRLINDVGIRTADQHGTEFRIPAVRGLHLMDSDSRGNTVRLGKAFRRLLDNMRNPDHLDFPVPDNLAPILRDYQIYGFQWLKTLAHYRFGGILADDMGLGKTVQSIAFIVSALPEIREQQLPAIIVAPASLVYNWRNELKKFAPQLRTVIADGTKEERTAALTNVAKADVIITSYPLLRRDIELYMQHSFHTLILDEAQMFKNHTTQTAQAVKGLQARYRFALTGTPVENRLDDLWSIFDAVFPELFPSRQLFSELQRETVAKRIRPFLLRRLKTDVLKELPEKIETLQASELLPEQKKLYVAYLAELQAETVKDLNKESFQKNRIKILAGITRLRQLCCHPALFVEGYTGSSAKFEQLLEIIEECRSAGKRVLIFSQFTQMLGIIGRELGYQGVPYFYLDGQTPGSERVELCSRFNEGERDVFLLSLKAGGTGLNLTGADTVILYDLWWNPAVEQQAADRAHRIGQKNVVQVIRLVTEGTVEDKMYDLQQRKKNLIDEVIQPGQESLSSLSEQDLREILMIE